MSVFYAPIYKIVTNGIIGEHEYNNFVELIKGLQGHNIKINDFYW